MIRVQAGTTPPSLFKTGITLASLPAPATPMTRITQIDLTATKNNGGDAAVVANGVDQGQVRVVISAGTALPASDPAYASVYYTDENGALVTNLYQQKASCTPNCYSNSVGVQPSAGAYPNTPSSSSNRRGATGATNYDYVSSNGGQTRTITAHVGTQASATTGNVNIDGTALALTTSGATAAAGFSVEGCADFANGSSTCSLAPITTPPSAGASGRPALYQAVRRARAAHRRPTAVPGAELPGQPAAQLEVRRRQGEPGTDHAHSQQHPGQDESEQLPHRRRRRHLPGDARDQQTVHRGSRTVAARTIMASQG